MTTATCSRSIRPSESFTQPMQVRDRIEQVRASWSPAEQRRRAELARQRQEQLLQLLATSSALLRSA
ncbi:MAG: hypothetical protein H6823_20510 [Planctomycetaceae bacterium]|nr:hypothetical protein [Planctomycetaceae bacterium]